MSGRLGYRTRFVVAAALALVVGAVLAFLVGGALAFFETRAIQTTVDGWSSARQCGQPGNNILVQSGCAQALTAVNVPQEAVYWTRTTDSAGQPFSGENAYVLHFPAGWLPPNDGFWSLTMTDTRARLVANAANRFAVGDRSGLVPNADGSLDISIQAAAPSGNQAKLAARSCRRLHALDSRLPARRGDPRRDVHAAHGHRGRCGRDRRRHIGGGERAVVPDPAGRGHRRSRRRSRGPLASTGGDRSSPEPANRAHGEAAWRDIPIGSPSV